jgi:Zn-dependent protease
LFGWAKPVPVNFANLRQPKRDMFWVAAAGPGVNFLMAIAWALLFGLGKGVFASSGLQYMALIGVSINVALMVLNLLPILPLDGGRIAVSLLPHSLAVPFARTERFGFFIVIALLVSGLLGVVLGPPVRIITSIIEAVTGITLSGVS